MMDKLTELLGVEHGLDEVNRALCEYVWCLNPAVVGALHVMCADESEWECIDSFQRCFVNEMLPDLKFGQKTAFRLSNLGGRYESGAIPVAEHHFATPESHHAFKVMLIRVSAHVATEGSGWAARFGRMRRYDIQSNNAARRRLSSTSVWVTTRPATSSKTIRSAYASAMPNCPHERVHDSFGGGVGRLQPGLVP